MITGICKNCKTIEEVDQVSHICAFCELHSHLERTISGYRTVYVKTTQEHDIYLALCETPHGKRYWLPVKDEDAVKDYRVQIFGPVTVGPEGYANVNDAIDSIADLENIALDAPETWPMHRGRFDVPVRLRCGCETVWHEGDTLAVGCYAWCSAHGDTTVTDILA